MNVSPSSSPERPPFPRRGYEVVPVAARAVAMLVAAFLCLPRLGIPQNASADSSAVLAAASRMAQQDGLKPQTVPCPGCDADVIPGKCGTGPAGDELQEGLRIPYGVGVSPRTDASRVNRVNRSIRGSLRSFDDSIRRMNDSINKIRNIRR